MKILVVRESGGWGDVLCTLFAVRGLRKKYPESHISYLCMEPFAPMLQRVPEINRVLVHGRSDSEPPRRVRAHRRHMGEPLDLKRYGLVHHYDLVVDLWCPADVHERATGGAIERSRIECFCDAAGVEYPPIASLSVTAEERVWANSLLNELLPGTLYRVLIQEHSAKVTKNWPMSSIERLGQILRPQGIGALTTRLQGPSVPGMPSVMGLSHLKVAALVAEANCVVAPDSGLFHLAAAVGTPCVALFGPTDPRQYMKHYPLASFLWKPGTAQEVGCNCPCLYYASNRFPPLNKHCIEEGECMRAILPQEVALAVYESLAEGRRVA